MTRTLRFLAGACVALGCDAETLPPQGQVLLYFDTDAPVPPAPGTQPPPGTPPALFDTLAVDVLPPGSNTPCGGCSRVFSLDVGRLTALQASIGVPAPPGVSGYRVRARMFPSVWQASCAKRQCGDQAGDAGSSDVGPYAGATVDVTVALPVVPAEGIIEQTLVLRTANVGRRMTVATGADYFSGHPTASLVSSWSPAQPKPCATSARSANEACIPGGAFWMGNPLVEGPGSWPHLVILAPFFMKTTEATLGDYAVLGLTVPVGALPECVGGRTSAPAEPVNCGVYSDATTFCAAWGGELPSEAEYEYVASGLSGWLFPWGDTAPSCTDAVWGHTTGVVGQTGVTPCGSVTAGLPPVADPTMVPRTLDGVDLGGVSVQDLAGSLSELSRDDWADDGPGSASTCWGVSGPLKDPVCKVGGTTTVLHSGSYVQAARPAAWRYPVNSATAYSIDVGFRCTRPDM